MDIAGLQAFIAVAEHRSFSAAAESLHLTQPAVSKRIAALEDMVRVRLFDRVGRRVLLTEAGAQLYPRARRIMSEVEDGRRALSNLSGTVGGVLSLATSHHIGLHRMPPILREFRVLYPHVRLDLRFMSSEDAYNAVVDGQVELAVVTLSPAPSAQIESVPLWNDELVVTARGDEDGRQPDLQEIASRPAILPGPETFTRQIIDSTLAAEGISPRVELSTNYLETIKMMVTVGLGWSVLPASMLDAELTRIPFRGNPVYRPLGLVRHPARTPSNAGRAMRELLVRAGAVGTQRD
ncbi:MAG: LysR family transcriptional regulator [Ectothiorhodospiraceae bacterium]